MSQLTLLDSTVIGTSEKPYFVAEVNSSHNGDIEAAKAMIKAAAECGCDCVKFQSWSTETLYSKSYYDANPIAKRFVKKFSLSAEQLASLAEFSRENGIAFSSTPYSENEVDELITKCKAPYIKIASMELNNPKFLEYIGRTGAPVVLSTGMGDMDEIRRAVKTIESTGNNKICLLHCISIYPCEVSTVNLNNILMLQKEFPDYPVGFSDHSVGTELAAAAIALGACFIEKHLTLDKTKIGMDNQMATEPEEMARLVKQCCNVHSAMGSYERVVSEDELKQRLNMRRSLVYARDMKAGEIISEKDIISKRPGTGFAPDTIDKLIGKALSKDVIADTLVLPEDIG